MAEKKIEFILTNLEELQNEIRITQQKNTEFFTDEYAAKLNRALSKIQQQNFTDAVNMIRSYENRVSDFFINDAISRAAAICRTAS